MTKKKEQVEQWTGYQGNKRKLIPLIMALTPKHTERFVDLFGGTGIVGANAYRFKRCKQVIYNDLEYDLVKVLEYMHDTDPEEVVKTQEKIAQVFFGDTVKLEGESLKTYDKIVGEYEESRLMLWDSERGAEDFEYAYDMKISVPDGKDVGDWELFLFLIRHSMFQTPNMSDYGRKLSMSPREDMKIKRNDPKLKDFVTAWHGTPVEFHSCDFTTGFLMGKQFVRPRAEEDMERFKDMMASLTEKDFVFIDPPYLGSKASYNSKWGHRMEVYLMAFCQMLAERKIPFLITNNLAWNTSLFTEWRKQFHCYMIREGARKVYANKEANDQEVFVSNKSLPPSKYKLHADLVRMTNPDKEAKSSRERALKEDVMG